MDNIFIIAGTVAVTYLLMKFIEMRFIIKENQSLKYLLRDTLIVYMSVLLGTFVIKQMAPITDMVGGSGSPTNAFTNNPEF